MDMVQGDGCDHQPQEGTIYNRAGLPVNRLSNLSDYPVDAVCMKCGRPIRRLAFVPAGPVGEWKLKYQDGEKA